FAVNHGDEYRWHVMNVGMWIGHRAYIECLDETDGYLMLDRIVFSEDARPPSEVANPLLVKLLDDDSLDSADKLEGKLRALLLETLALWGNGKLDGQPDGRSRALLINRLLKNELLQRASVPVADERTKRRQMQEQLEAR